MAGDDVSAVHRALNTLFTTLTPEQMQNFIQEMNAANTAAINGNSAIMVPSSNASDIPQSNPSNAIVATVPISNNAITRPPSRAKRSRETGKLRPLNSFIAFRSKCYSIAWLVKLATNVVSTGFYSAMFPDLSQKVKSGLLRLLWNSDPFKAKWAILAKAYSTVRDKHTGKVSLDTFLALNGPFIGIVKPADYLKVMGVQLVAGADKQFSLVKAPQGAGPSQCDMTTMLSVDDIVDHCYQMGYVARDLSDNDRSHQGVGVAMAVSAQPSHIQLNNTRYNAANRDTPLASQNSLSAARNAGRNNFPTTTGDMYQNANQTVEAPQFATDLQNYHAAMNNNISSATQNERHAISTRAPDGSEISNPQFNAAVFEEDLRNSMNDYQFQAHDEYYGLFNELNRSPPGVYNPYRVRSEFDPFDINEYLDM